MRVAIIGGGAGGVLAAVALLRGATAADEISIIEPAALGAGVAYAVQHQHALLNVRAANMSAYSDEPGHFVAWLATHHPEVPADGFAPRQWYAAYLRDTLAAAQTRSAGRFAHVQASVTDVIPAADGANIALSDGRVLHAHQVVLAVGHNAPVNPLVRWLPQSSRIVSGYAWVNDPQPVAVDALVLIVGTGLTMVDAVLTLLNAGHRGPIVAYSRRGYLPLGHVARATFPAPLTRADAQRPLSDLLRDVRRAVADAAAAGIPWQAVIDSLRPHTQALWQAFPDATRQRFLRHVRAVWDIHRHRIAPEITEQIAAAQRSGQLRIVRGRAQSAVEGTHGVSVLLRSAAGEQTLTGALVINCTGPQTDFARVETPLIATLRARGLLSADSLRLGIASGIDARVWDLSGQPIPWLWTIGPLRKGLLWECIAIPDMRNEAPVLAADVLAAGIDIPAEVRS